MEGSVQIENKVNTLRSGSVTELSTADTRIPSQLKPSIASGTDLYCFFTRDKHRYSAFNQDTLETSFAAPNCDSVVKVKGNNTASISIPMYTDVTTINLFGQVAEMHQRRRLLALETTAIFAFTSRLLRLFQRQQ